MTNLRTLVRRMLPSPVKSAMRTGYRPLNRLGNQCECPCCGSTFRRFMPHGLVTRANARCQECGALARHRVLWLYLRQQSDLFRAPLRVLHFAPEPQFEQALRRLANLDYTTADLEPGRADVQVDIRRIPYPDGTFDVLICNHVLEHVTDDRLAMREVLRVLKAGGWAILMVPIELDRATTFEDATVVTPEDRLRVFGQQDHVRIYGRDYAERLRQAGFIVEDVQYGLTRTAEERRRYGLGGEVVFRCWKSA